MPGRYLSDTNSRCLLVSRSTWTTTMVDTCYPVATLTGTASVLGIASFSSSGGNFAAAAPRATDGIILNQTVASGIDNVLTFDVVKLEEGDEEGVLVTVLETIDNVPYVIGGGRLRQGKDQRIDFRATGNNIQVVLNGPYTNLVLAQVCTRYARSTAQTYLVEVCDESKDRYRFGFNGQEKVNEIAGVGNHNTAEFWEYDTRLGRRWNLDPVKDHSQSAYAAFNNNSILNTDKLGNVGEPVVKDGQLIIYSDFLFYGGAASPELAAQAASNMQTQWTNAKGTVTFKGTEYKDVKFVVTARVVSESTAILRAELNQGRNYDPRLNFARIENKNTLPKNTPNRVVGNWGGDNSMFFLADDITATSTNQSHELGHSFGIDKHISSFEKFKGRPRIMTTIQTIVEGEYTKDGQDGVSLGPRTLPLHLLKQDCRTVTQEDLNDIKTSNYNRSNRGDGKGSGERVGSSSNVLFDSQGKPSDKK